MQSNPIRGLGQSPNGGLGGQSPPTAKPSDNFIRFWGHLNRTFPVQIYVSGATTALASCVCYIYQNFECTYTPVLVPYKNRPISCSRNFQQKIATKKWKKTINLLQIRNKTSTGVYANFPFTCRIAYTGSERSRSYKNVLWRDVWWNVVSI